MTTYIVRTGPDYENVVDAATPYDAAVKAFREDPPEQCGVLVVVATDPDEDRDDDMYMLSERIIKAAGYEYKDHAQ